MKENAIDFQLYFVLQKIISLQTLCDKSSEPIKTNWEFITKVGNALADVTLELQGSFTLEMHLVLNLVGVKLLSKYVSPCCL